MAFSAKGQFTQSMVELENLQELAQDPAVAKIALWSPNSVGTILSNALTVLEGDMAARQRDYDRAIAQLDRGTRLQDGLTYIEPPDWGLPVRHVLGATLLEADRPAEAEAVYWEDLRRSLENGWALFGLSKVLREQGKREQAELIEQRFSRAWPDPDVKFEATRFRGACNRKHERATHNAVNLSPRGDLKCIFAVALVLVRGGCNAQIEWKGTGWMAVCANILETSSPR